MTDSGESSKKEDLSDSAEDPLVEIPKLSGNECIKRSKISRLDIRGMVVRCTTCNQQINHLDSEKVKRHIRLNVLVCIGCHEFYGSGEFSQDESGNYNYCTWCGNGGKLFLCDFCPNVFCVGCVRRNFGRAEVSKMDKEGWKCFCCEPKKLKRKVAYCDMILDYSMNSQKKDKKLISDKTVMVNGTQTWTEAQEWVLPAFDEVHDSCKTLHRKMDKLKTIGMSHSKSLKHIIKKLEEVIDGHKRELSHVIRSLSRKYVKHIETMKKADEQSGKETDSNSNTKKVNNDTKTDESKDPDYIQEIDLSQEIFEESAASSKKEDGLSHESSVAETVAYDKNYEAKLALLNNSETSPSEDELKESGGPPEEVNSTNDDSFKISLNEVKTMSKDKETADDILENGTSEANEKKRIKTTGKLSDSDPEKPVTIDISETPLKPELDDSVESKIVSKKSASRKLKFLSSDSDVSVYLSSDNEEEMSKRKIKQKSRESKPKTPKVVTLDDPKLKLKTTVVIQKCDHLLPDGETTIVLPANLLFEDLDKEINSLLKEPKKYGSRKTNATEKKEKPSDQAPKKYKAAKKKKESESSSSIDLSSSDDESAPTRKKLFKASKDPDDLNTLAKKELLSDDSSLSDDSEEDSESPKKKKKSGKGKAHSSSSEDFQPRKKRKYDKLLHKRILSDDDSSKDSEKKSGDRKKQEKRKFVGSEDSKSENKKIDSDTTTSESDEDKPKKKKKRKRIRKAASSSSDGEKNKKDDNESQNTPGKGRKNIKKILSKKDLALETKEAQNLERERRKRVLERQKLYNEIVDTSKDGNEIITRKMVLEVDPDSKEEIVEIHPELVEKLKPHQVKGVKFMWECTIESVKQLEEEIGSGCILAHCMGLGKTLQVITFLHTCLTNKYVNKHIQTAMVICPYNTVLNWVKEFDHWLGNIDGDIKVHQLTAVKDNYTRLDILEYWKQDGGVLIISYDIFRRLALTKVRKMPKKSRDKLLEYLINPGPDIVVCDEGHILKNVNSAISKACALLASERRIVLTGTPLQNNLLEYHCMLSFVKPHLLGTPKEFRNRFVNPIMNGQYDDSNDFDVKRMKKRIHILHKLLEGCVQRCDYAALTKFLPPKHEFVISVKLSEVQIKMYQWYLDNLSQSRTQEKIQGGTLFKDYNALRNLCTHPYIMHTGYERAEKRRLQQELYDDEEEDEFINDESEEETAKSGSTSEETEEVVKVYKTRSRRNESGVESDESEEELPKEKRWYEEFISLEDCHKIELSGKMVILFEILKECEAIGDKVILFSQSLLTLDIVEDLLNYIASQPVSEEDKTRDISNNWTKNVDYFRMDGSTSADFRKQYIDHFNDPEHLRARLFLVSTKAGGLGTNLVGANRVVMLDASWNPSHDVQAIFRVYRFGQHKPVYIYRLLAQGTMEERIYDRQVTKLSLSIRVVDEQQIDRHFNAAELAELYKFEPESQPNRPTPLVPKDTLLAEMLMKHKDWIVTYHEHDSLLQNETEEDLTEEERKAAWNEYENEREGRNVDGFSYDNEMMAFCKEPDFSEASYEGSVLPSAKTMIEAIIASLRQKFPLLPAIELRKKLLISLFTLRAMFQEKHVKILRMKSEYVAKGSVPVAVNKYLEELNVVLRELTQHYDTVNGIVMREANEAMPAQNAQKFGPQPMQNAQFAGYRPSFRPTYTNLPNLQTGVPPQYARFRMPSMQQFQANMNFGRGVNFKPGDNQWNPALSQAYAKLAKAWSQMPNAGMKPASTSQPVITEADKDQPNNSSNENSAAKSTVVIEEIE